MKLTLSKKTLSSANARTNRKAITFALNEHSRSAGLRASRFFTLNYDTSDRASLLIRALTPSFFPKTHSNPGVRDSPLPPGTCQPHSQTADRPCGPLNSRSGGDCRWTCLPPGVIYTRTTISNTSKKRRIGASYRDFNVNTVGK